MKKLRFACLIAVLLSKGAIGQTKAPGTSIKPLSKKGGLTEKKRADFVNGGPIHRINVIKADSLMWLTADKYTDHRIFGYEKPDAASKKMIAISIFTDDVEGNPFGCPYGAYYDINGAGGLRLKFIARAGNYIKVIVTKDKLLRGSVYIPKKWIRFV